jgi:hypothetical protein
VAVSAAEGIENSHLMRLSAANVARTKAWARTYIGVKVAPIISVESFRRGSEIDSPVSVSG